MKLHEKYDYEAIEKNLITNIREEEYFFLKKLNVDQDLFVVSGVGHLRENIPMSGLYRALMEFSVLAWFKIDKGIERLIKFIPVNYINPNEAMLKVDMTNEVLQHLFYCYQEGYSWKQIQEIFDEKMPYTRWNFDNDSRNRNRLDFCRSSFVKLQGSQKLDSEASLMDLSICDEKSYTCLELDPVYEKNYRARWNSLTSQEKFDIITRKVKTPDWVLNIKFKK